MRRVLLASLLLSLLPVAAQAMPQPFADKIEWLAERGPDIGAAEAARLASEAFGGRVLAVHQTSDGQLYRVRLLIGGQVRVVLVDARTGRVLR